MHERLENAAYMLKYSKMDFVKDFGYILVCFPIMVLVVLLIILESVVSTACKVKATVWYLLDINGEQFKVLGLKEVDGVVINTKDIYGNDIPQQDWFLGLKEVDEKIVCEKNREGKIKSGSVCRALKEISKRAKKVAVIAIIWAIDDRLHRLEKKN